MTASLSAAASTSALVQKIERYQSAGYDRSEAISQVAREMNVGQGGDIFWAVAHLGLALQLNEKPTLEEAAMAQLSFGR